jgi:hypothetical protein
MMKIYHVSLPSHEVDTSEGYLCDGVIGYLIRLIALKLKNLTPKEREAEVTHTANTANVIRSILSLLCDITGQPLCGRYTGNALRFSLTYTITSLHSVVSHIVDG